MAKIWIARHLTPSKQAEVIRCGIPGVYFQHAERRVYPHGPLVSHILGFTDIDNQGIAGIEKYFNQQLLSDQTNLQLSLDLRIQHMLREELIAGIKKFRAQGAAGIVMKIKTGEVLAMASLPDFNPNQVSRIGSNSELLFNRMTLGVYEMGSTFKIINTALALDQGIVNLSSEFEVAQPLYIGRFRITDYPRQSERPLNVAEIFIKSSNIGSAKMALMAGPERQRSFFKKLGFFKSLNIEVPETATPLYPKNWGEVTTITALKPWVSAIPCGLSTIINIAY